ncbi:MAG: histidine kinase dimerization/phospho-acceptor domain-containing protein, partial [Candidatus Levybacteria bacterium]|nr:histidine kinase dimerization/phospho-acceptor domain-containing protein [Candidatus Levybacteria bacterium]
MNTFSTTPKAQGTISSLWKLEKIILDTLDFKEVVQRIVDSVLTELGYLDLGYCIIVLTLIDEEKQILKRISISKTEQARKALEASPIPFEKIDIPLTETNNLLIRALNSKVPWVTNNLSNVLCPPLDPKDVEPVQLALGIKSTSVYPVSSRGKVIGTLIFSLLKGNEEVSVEERDLLAGFTDVVGLAVQNARLYSSLNETSEKLKEANERLKEVDRLKDEFVSLASHELRTPMTVIKSYLWMMLDKNNVSALSEKQKMYIDRAYTSTQRLINLVNDMLNVSRIESGRFTLAMKSLDLGSLIGMVYAEMLPKAQEQKINLQFARPLQSLPKVQADPE